MPDSIIQKKRIQLALSPSLFSLNHFQRVVTGKRSWSWIMRKISFFSSCHFSSLGVKLISSLQREEKTVGDFFFILGALKNRAPMILYFFTEYDPHLLISFPPYFSLALISHFFPLLPAHIRWRLACLIEYLGAIDISCSTHREDLSKEKPFFKPHVILV